MSYISFILVPLRLHCDENDNINIELAMPIFFHLNIPTNSQALKLLDLHVCIVGTWSITKKYKLQQYHRLDESTIHGIP